MEALTEPPPRQPERHTGILVFGILHIILGILSAGVVLVMAATHEIEERRGGVTSGAALASAVVVYGVASAYFIAAGVGSIRGRRWARSLAIVVSAMWTVAGVVGGLMVAVVLPRVLRAYGSTDVTMVAGCVAIAILVCGIALPVVIFLFYRRPEVRVAFEAMDRKSRWTDRVPLPVLAVILFLAFAAIALLANLANPTFAAFGREVSGAPAALTMFALAGLSAFLAVQVYRLQESAWWALVILQLIGVGYAIASFTMSGGASTAAPGTPPEIAAIYRDPLFIAIFIATWIGYFAFLLYLRRFFVMDIEPRTRRTDQSTFSG